VAQQLAELLPKARDFLVGESEARKRGDVPDVYAIG